MACDTFKLQRGDYPKTLEDLAKKQPALLAPKSAEKFNYDPDGRNNLGLQVDIWVEGPRAKSVTG
jgi:hypothetical protein